MPLDTIGPANRHLPLNVVTAQKGWYYLGSLLGTLLLLSQKCGF